MLLEPSYQDGLRNSKLCYYTSVNYTIKPQNIQILTTPTSQSTIMEVTKMIFPQLEQIKLIREKIVISQVQLAKKAGISQSTIPKYENGTQVPSYNTAKKIFQILLMYFLKRFQQRNHNGRFHGTMEKLFPEVINQHLLQTMVECGWN